MFDLTELLALILFAALASNPHDGEVYAIPPKYAVAAYRAAASRPTVEPEEILATIVAEHGGGAPYPADSIGSSGEVGLLQTSAAEIRAYNETHGTSYARESLLDPLVAIEVGAEAIERMKATHATAWRCRRRVEVCSVEPNGDGSLGASCSLEPQRHSWWAHYRYGPKSRERGSTKWREGVAERISRWRLLIRE